jgi:hypothetical protein
MYEGDVMNRDTIGTISNKLLLKQPDSRSPIEIMQEQLTDYEKNVEECVKEALSKYQGDFYVVVLCKRERLMTNVYRNYFFARTSCPSPEWDQTVYKYIRDGDTLDFLWVIPAKDVCQYLRDNALQVVGEERELLNFVIQFSTGTLLRLAKKLNNEVDDSPLLEKRDIHG